jgi:5-carboxymethyl-2-hydroxymuconic-semialdehyde dehydrogenase
MAADPTLTPMAEHRDLLVGGVTRPAAEGETFEVTDPHDGAVIATVARGGVADVDAALTCATRAFEEGAWPRLAPVERGRTVLRVAALLRERADAFVACDVANAGKPVESARWEVEACASTFEYYGGAADKVGGEVPPIAKPGLAVVLREPVGVCALIVPWNFPLMIAGWKVAPALACGNTIVLKPASNTPLSALLLGEVLVDAGVPADAVSVLPGPGATVGDVLVGDPRVHKVSFTGETTTGTRILQQSAPNIARVALELGGKSPCVVFADADLDAAIDSALFGVFSLNGERCTAGSRILVERAIYDEFCEKYAARAKNIVVGDPHDPKTQVGALVHPEHYEKVASYVEIGKSEGRLLAGGGRPDHLPEGNYIAPTVFADVAPDARIFQEEIFGPVVAITPFENDDEALALANNTKYGLAAYIWTQNLTRAHNFSQNVEAGMVWLNSHNVRDLRTPFGGVKASGLGHEGGYRSIDFYTDQQAVHITLGTAHTPKFGA